jgi:hypothetical protein
MSKVNNGIDAIAAQSANVVAAAYMQGAGGVGSITATSASLTGVTGPTGSSGGPPHNTGALIGKMLVLGARYGVILQHTAGPPAVITLDQWTDPATGLVGTTPATGQYVIVPGNAPAAYMGLSVATLTIAATHPFLTNDGTTVSEIWNGSGGLNRAIAAYAHTVGTATYTLTKTFTSTGTDPASSTVHRVGIFQHQVAAAPSTTTTGIMVYETNLSADAIITNNGTDSLTVTETVTIS